MHSVVRTPALGRRVVASLWAAVLFPYAALALWVPAARALGVFARVPVPLVAALSSLAGVALALLVPRLSAALPESLDRWFDREHRARSLLWAAGALFALLSFGRIAVFLGDPSYTSCSLMPSDAFLTRHSCLTAYMHGGILSTRPGANVYDMAFVEGASASAPLPPTAAHFAPFKLDAYGYPPPFLLLPRALLALTASFLSQRVLFSAGSLLLAFFACASVAKTLGGDAERRAWLLTPVLLSNPLVLATVQVGNFHLAAVAICTLCWVALERRRDPLAGALLAVATLSKIFPGLLGVLLLLQRRWRAAAYTALFAAALCALSVAVLGAGVWRDFLHYHLPRVQSGEALRFLADTPREIAFNYAPFGIPFKLRALGFEGWGWAEARTFGNLYTVLVLVLAALAGRNQGSPQHRLSVWLAVVALGSLRSPYAAPFVLLTAVFLLLVLAAEVRTRRHLAGFLCTFALFSVPGLVTTPRAAVLESMARGALVYAFLLWAALRRERARPVEATGDYQVILNSK